MGVSWPALPPPHPASHNSCETGRTAPDESGGTAPPGVLFERRSSVPLVARRSGSLRCAGPARLGRDSLSVLVPNRRGKDRGPLRSPLTHSGRLTRFRNSEPADYRQRARVQFGGRGGGSAGEGASAARHSEPCARGRDWREGPDGAQVPTVSWIRDLYGEHFSASRLWLAEGFHPIDRAML